jgi:hypothetical protein
LYPKQKEMKKRLGEINKELESYKEILDKVKSLEKEKKEILKKIEKEKISALPFENQFETFFTSKKGVRCSDLFELETIAPKFYSKFVDDHFCLDRYQTYEIDMFYGELSSIFSEESKLRYKESLGYDDEDFEAELKDIFEIGKELMDNKVRGWKQDW